MGPENPSQLLEYLSLRLERLDRSYTDFDPGSKRVRVGKLSPLSQSFFMIEVGYLVAQGLSDRKSSDEFLEELIKLCDKHSLLDPRTARMSQAPAV